jgi:penicillin-binding protein 2
MSKIFRIIFMFVFLMAGCAPTTVETAIPSATPPPTATLAEPGLQTTRPPDVQAAARSYLEAWLAEDYAAMYALLTTISQDAITPEKFEKFYRDVAAEAALNSWDYEILSSLVNPRSAQVGYTVILHSVLVGDLQRETQMSLSLEQGNWRVQWDEALLMPELHNGNYLRMEYRSPSRANIYDKNGSALVAQSDAVAIGLDTGLVDPESENSLLNELFRLTGVRPETLRPRLEAYRPNGWYLPVADVSAEALNSFSVNICGRSGVICQPFQGRYYFEGGIASHVVGYVSAIQAEEVETYKRLGYNVNSDRVGQKGLEVWGEKYLGGTRGGVLYLVAPDGAIITRLAESSPGPAQAIYTTLDKNLQMGVQAAMSKFRGAIVVLERDTGRVLAMASSPGFNPNLFEPQNYNSSSQILDLFNLDELPLLNRATQGQYPLGSVFKIVTMAAALENNLYTPESEYNCQYTFTELQGVTLNDWTYDRFLKDGKTQPSGILTLPQGLMRSCNPWFYKIGFDFYSRGMVTSVSDMARGFGLGAATGIELPEEAGNIPNPGSPLDATNLAIGQGDMLVTPLQVAAFVAAIGNGGTLYVPHLIERITSPDGIPSFEFTPEARSTLPVSEAKLAVIQEAMVNVVRNPRGTAYFVLGPFSSSYSIPIAGKTGTAQSGFGDPHAWFAGYTFAGRENLPDIAVVVIAERSGEGSEIAGPIFRRVMEVYFLGKPQIKYPWEAQIGIVATPTSEATDTPVGEAEATPTPEE